MPRSKNADSSSANGHVELQPLNVDDNDYSKHEEEANNDKKVEEKKPPEKKSVSLLTLYRYATGWDR
uniref:Uncharacterized protein n=1 Tax=Plectus sambesii TaxID=2011161 RepID=A0A914VLT3_9BILA